MPSILLVEDHPPMRATLRMWLADLAAPITECDNGAEVCACYARHQPDWVLMDIDLPGQDGITTTHQLLTANPTAQVLMVTGYDDVDMRNAATAAGARGYVLKENLQELRHWFQVINTIETTNSTHLPAAEKGKKR
ncbi:MAG: response regulator transcription factor [Blastocatellia bacterium]|nr:response regulator transcription factor [Blastocatellia bacterium]